jgi:hypothetical protein
MTDVSAIETRDVHEHRRSTKFTSENIRQIVNLVDRGKSRDEIAEIIGVTPGTLSVTCSKMGISLRRPSFNLGTGRLRAQRRRLQNDKHQDVGHDPSDDGNAQRATSPVMPRKHEMDVIGPSEHTQAMVAFTIRHKGRERVAELPLTNAIIGQLAIEAEFRGVKLPELVARLLMTITQRDLFGFVLDGAPKTAPSDQLGEVA